MIISFCLQYCDCIFHDFAVFTRVQIDLSQGFCNRYKCVKIINNDVFISGETNIGEKLQYQPIEYQDQNRNKSVEQRFLEVCHELEQSHLHRLKLCFENAAALMIDEPSIELHGSIAGFIERMINACLPLGIPNSTGLNDARNILNEIRQSLLSNQPNGASNDRFLIEKSNKFYQMIPHIEFNFAQPKKLPKLNTEQLCNDKNTMIDHLEAVTGTIHTGRQTENINPLEFVYNSYMNVELVPILREHSEYGAFITDFSIENSQHIKWLFSKRNHSTTSTDGNMSENFHYLFHSTHLGNMIDILKGGLRVAPDHVFSYNRWYGRGIYFYGDFGAAYHHANRVKQKIILVCRVAMGNIEILENNVDKYTSSNSVYPLGADNNSLQVYGSLSRSSFEFDQNYGAFLPRKPEITVEPLEMLKILCRSSYSHSDEFVVQQENRVKIEYIIELND